MEFYPLHVSKVTKETKDAYSIELALNDDLKDKFVFLPGQYITVKATIGDKEVRRPYSIHSMPGQNTISIAVKKVKHGLMSHFLPTLTAGDTLEISNPEGHFVVKTDHSKSRGHHFIAAGSGITPVLSMIQTILEEEPKSTCYLLYGSRDEEQIIFKNNLDMLEKKYAGQFFINHVLSKPLQQKAAGIAGMFGKKTTEWKGLTGRIRQDVVSEFIGKNKSKHGENHFYLCGPGDMIEKAEKVIVAEGIDNKHIHREFFTPAKKESNEKNTALVGGLVNLQVTLKGQEHHIEMPAQKLILDVLVEKKLDPPYSCTSGACSTCMAKVNSGVVKMDSCFALDQDEVEAGYILTCQARPISDSVTITYDI